MGKDGNKWGRRKKGTITDENAPELRIKNPTAEEYIYVANLAKLQKRSLPDQLRIIIKEHKELSSKYPS